MCGITGIIQNTPVDLSDITKMNDTLRHRGPNGYGYLTTPSNLNMQSVDYLNTVHCVNVHLALGHRRLAIHDLSEAGRQPMQYYGRYWIVFNGEIYNYLALKQELENKGYRFSSKTDTEVLIAAYDCFGVDCLKKFNGDWAFVLIDLLKNKIFISRDRFGIKPLYIYFQNGLFLFASEIKALLQHPAVKRKPNFNYINHYVKYGPREYVAETAFENILHFNFASYFEGDLSELLDFQHTKLKCFFKLQPNLSLEVVTQETLEKYAKEYKNLLEDAVSLRMRADVSVGANLSGGLDSASIVFLMDKILHQENNADALKTFSSIYRAEGTQDCDESVHINELTTQLHIKSYQIEPLVHEISAEHQKMIYHLDAPPDSTLMSSWYTARLLSQEKVTVTLTGEGADEQLAGYLRYLAYFFAQIRTQDIFSQYAMFKKICDAKIYLWLGIAVNSIGKIVGKKMANFISSLICRQEKLFTPVNEKLKEDMFGVLVNLHHVDERVSMAFSIEQRSPFMDYRLVEFLASIPASFKLAKGWTKYFARYAFNKQLPDTVVWNKKKLGWPIPEKYWFTHELKVWMDTTINDSEFLHRYFFCDVKKTHKLSTHSRVRLLNLAVWYKIFFDS